MAHHAVPFSLCNATYGLPVANVAHQSCYIYCLLAYTHTCTCHSSLMLKGLYLLTVALCHISCHQSKRSTVLNPKVNVQARSDNLQLPAGLGPPTKGSRRHANKQRGLETNSTSITFNTTPVYAQLLTSGNLKAVRKLLCSLPRSMPQIQEHSKHPGGGRKYGAFQNVGPPSISCARLKPILSQLHRRYIKMAC